MTALVDDFTAAFRAHPAAVALITATTPDGPVGLTASSVASLSVDPPAISFSLSRTTGSAGRLLQAESFLVHLLGDAHSPLAESFARSGNPRFTAEQGWSIAETGEPLFADAPVALRCRPLGELRVGSAVLLAAEVLDIRRGRASGPLLYHERTFFGLDKTVPAALRKDEENDRIHAA